MLLLFVALCVVSVGLYLMVSKRRKAAERATVQIVMPFAGASPAALRSGLDVPPVSVAAHPSGAHPPPAPAPQAISADLDAFRLVHAEQLAADRCKLLVEALGSVPRPPRALHELISLDFVARATSDQLVDLVMTEPLVVTKVLAKVNAPIYGIKKPVTKLGHAITFLGTTSVRNVCLRYLLDESFKTADLEMRQIFGEISDASSIAAELCARLSRHIAIDDAALLTTHIVMSFTGHLAVASIQTRSAKFGAYLRSSSLLQRFIHQQTHCGLAAPEVGKLLKQAWKLPAELIDDVVAIDRLLVARVDEGLSLGLHSRAIGYLCARLGERIARGDAMHAEAVDAILDADPDFHFFRTCFDPTSFAALRAALQAPGLLENLDIEAPEAAVAAEA
ncbi:MAG: HDOD domain-containing protein [Gammaproteobacteria bacterium]|nr:HDOD domain-containing protein [Gammaproteobacteria bacterium]MBU1441678.1 HDOD domain-containing protein [Gammaproteobacteria bacterium]